MAQLIKHFKQLPTWFNLCNYAGLDGLDALDWLQQFLVRASLKEALLRHSPDAKELLAQLCSSPIVDTASDRGLRALGEVDGILQAARGGDAGVGGAYLGSVLDHLEDARRLDPTALATAVAVHERIESGMTAVDEKLAMLPLLEQFMVPLAFSMPRPGPRVSAYLDMTMPDWLLEQQLKALLREARRLPGVPSASSLAAQRPKPESWVKFGVLPYLDLQLWALEADVKIVNRVMADAIYPPGEGDEYTVRTSTATWAAELSSVAYLRLLAYWVAGQKAVDAVG